MKHIFLIFSVFFIFSQKSLAGKIKCPENPIRVGFYFRYEVLAGYEHKVIDELMSRLGCSHEKKVMKRARVWKEILENGNLEFTTSAIPTTERLKKLWFVPNFQVKHKVFLNQPDGLLSQSFEEFYNKKHLKMGMVNGYVHTPYYDEKLALMAKENRLVKFIDDQQLFKALDTQTVHGVLSFPLAYAHYKKDKNTRGKISIEDWDKNSKMVISGLMFSKKVFSQKNAEIIKKNIENMKSEGVLENFLKEVLTPEEIKEALSY